MPQEKKTPFERLKEAADGAFAPKPELGIPPAAVAKPVDGWQIVVVGAIDVRQHHPYWYHTIDCIKDDELASGIKTINIVNANMVNAQVAAGISHSMFPDTGFVQFDVGAFAITALRDRWIISTANEKTCDRILQVTNVVFKKLNEISILAFGINKTWSAILSRTTAKQFLANQVSRTDLALPKGQAEAQVFYTHHLGASDLTIHLTPSPQGEKWLNVMYNRHHPIASKTPKPGNKLGYFDLGELVMQHAKADWQSATDYGLQLAECIAREEKIEHGN